MSDVTTTEGGWEEEKITDLKDMCVTFTDKMDKADTEAETAFEDSFR